eukprot:351233-Rhodomonas_salina.5
MVSPYPSLRSTTTCAGTTLPYQIRTRSYLLTLADTLSDTRIVIPQTVSDTRIPYTCAGTLIPNLGTPRR